MIFIITFGTKKAKPFVAITGLSIGVLGADVPPASQRPVKMHAYAGVRP
jgi:hypothetical protein